MHDPDDGKGEVGVGVEPGYDKLEGGFLGAVAVGHSGEQVVPEYPVLPLVQFSLVVAEHVDVVVLE